LEIESHVDDVKDDLEFMNFDEVDELLISELRNNDSFSFEADFKAILNPFFFSEQSGLSKTAKSSEVGFKEDFSCVGELKLEHVRVHVKKDVFKNLPYL
jgi:hypothetical protein